jgi:hypothetical protein
MICDLGTSCVVMRVSREGHAAEWVKNSTVQSRRKQTPGLDNILIASFIATICIKRYTTGAMGNLEDYQSTSGGKLARRPQNDNQQ